eukprot:880937-Prorocentrum_minimum.AAC.3
MEITRDASPGQPSSATVTMPVIGDHILGGSKAGGNRSMDRVSLYVALVTVGGLLIGYESGIVSGMFLSEGFNQTFNTLDNSGAITACFAFGAALGSLSNYGDGESSRLFLGYSSRQPFTSQEYFTGSRLVYPSASLTEWYLRYRKPFTPPWSTGRVTRDCSALYVWSADDDPLQSHLRLLHRQGSDLDHDLIRTCPFARRAFHFGYRGGNDIHGGARVHRGNFTPNTPQHAHLETVNHHGRIAQLRSRLLAGR